MKEMSSLIKRCIKPTTNKWG